MASNLTPNLIPLDRLVDEAFRGALGIVPRSTDPLGFNRALSSAFSLKEEDGYTVWTWTPGTIGATVSGNPMLPGIVTIRARELAEKGLPLLGSLFPLLPDYDPQDVEAIHNLVRGQLTELVNEVGRKEGARNQRIRVLLTAINNHLPTIPPMPPASSLPAIYGLIPANAKTLDEQKNIDNYRTLRQLVENFDNSWNNSPRLSLGEGQVRRERLLAVIAETMQEVREALEEESIGPAELATISIPNTGTQTIPPMSAEDALNWIESFATQEGVALARQANGGAFQQIKDTATDLQTLAQSVLRVLKPATPSDLRDALTDLGNQLKTLVGLPIP